MLRGWLALIYSFNDPVGLAASNHIVSHVKGWAEVDAPRAKRCHRNRDLGLLLAGFEESLLNLEFLDEILDVDAYVFLSKHRAESGRPSLTVHSTGNYSDATYGGRPRELAWSHPRLKKAIMVEYYDQSRRLGLTSKYWVGLEATHHGPTSLSKPVVFVEVGSTPSEWGDRRAIEALSSAVVNVALRGPEGLPNCVGAVGFGGTHYPERHTKRMVGTDVCYGHVLARYALRDPDPGVVAQAMDKNVGGVKTVIIEKKSVRSEVRELIVAEAERRGLVINYI